METLNSQSAWAKVKAAFKQASDRFSGKTISQGGKLRIVNGHTKDATKGAFYNTSSISGKKN